MSTTLALVAVEEDADDQSHHRGCPRGCPRRRQPVEARHIVIVIVIVIIIFPLMILAEVGDVECCARWERTRARHTERACAA